MRDETSGLLFDVPLAPVRLEAGAELEHHVLRGHWWGPPEERARLHETAVVLSSDEARRAHGRILCRSRADLAALRARAPVDGPGLLPDVPTVLLVHALTGDARAGGPEGWWEPVVGPGRPIEPRRCRVLGFNNLGSCYGSSGPADEGFPRRSDDRRFPAPAPIGKGAHAVPEDRLPATVTTWDQARSLLMALSRLGVDRVHLAAGGSLGAQIVLAMAALAPTRIERALVIGAAVQASPWLIGWNHIMRELLLLDPGFPHDARRGLALAREVGHMTYRAQAGLTLRHGRRHAPDAEDETDGWSSRRAYRVQTYLEHQGRKFLGRFDARSYLAQLDACDHHDLHRAPPWVAGEAARAPWGPARITASLLGVDIDTDNLYPDGQMAALVDDLKARGQIAAHAWLTSPHGHDAFLMEWDQVRALAARAMALPATHGKK